jgi:abortive infection bacteriophage resistance protein
MTKYLKPSLTLEDQINLLVSRGLIIDDPVFAKHILSNISYYRLSSYFYNFWEDKSGHKFFGSTKFERIVNIYNFDSELRTICFKAIELIEVSIRTKLSLFLSHNHGPYWFDDDNIVINKISHADNIKSIQDLLNQKIKEQFIKDHLKKYNDQYPPSWKLLEITSFGLLSRLYGNISPSVKEKKAIARSLGLPNHEFLESWLKSIAYIRNICAHHSRLWDKKLSTPLIPNNLKGKWLSKASLTNLKRDGLYINLCCIKYLVDNIKPDNDFGSEILRLLKNYKQDVNLDKMHFPKSWDKDDLWK